MTLFSTNLVANTAVAQQRIDEVSTPSTPCLAMPIPPGTFGRQGCSAAIDWDFTISMMQEVSCDSRAGILRKLWTTDPIFDWFSPHECSTNYQNGR
jgi:hypothetical protein